MDNRWLEFVINVINAMMIGMIPMAHSHHHHEHHHEPVRQPVHGRVRSPIMGIRPTLHSVSHDGPPGAEQRHVTRIMATERSTSAEKHTHTGPINVDGLTGPGGLLRCLKPLISLVPQGLANSLGFCVE